MISVDEALALVLDTCTPLETEEVALPESLDRFLAEPVVAHDTIPAAPTSAMDGWAVHASDLTGEAAELEVVGEIPAGSVPAGPLRPGQTMKIFTGSLLPEGADAVVIVERSQLRGERVALEGPARPGQHVRPAGEVVRTGDTVLPPGVRLGPGHLGLLATLGYACPRVARRPRIVILPTGSELVPVHAALEPGKVRDSNSVALAAQVTRTGGTSRFLGPARDDRETLRSMIEEGIETSDVLITSGGVSMGDYDLVGEVLEELGCTIHFTRVRVKPGKPVTFATRGEKQVFGLPGNPVSSMVSFELFCRPALRKRMGALDLERPLLGVQVNESLRKPADRRDYQRARIDWSTDGPRADLTGPQGSGIMVSMAAAQALLVLAEGESEVPAGSRVPALLLDECLERVTS